MARILSAAYTAASAFINKTQEQLDLVSQVIELTKQRDAATNAIRQQGQLAQAVRETLPAGRAIIVEDRVLIHASNGWLGILDVVPE